MDTSGNMHPYKFVVFVNIFLLFGATSRAQQLPRPQDIDLDLINAKSLSPSGVKVNVADDIKLASSLHADCSNVDVGDFTSPGLDIIFPVMAKKDAILPLSTFNNATQSHRRHVVVRFTFRGERHKLKLQHNSHLLKRKEKPGLTLEENCYYQGYCSRSEHLSKENFVSMSTCYGLRGVIQISGESYRIYPHQLSNPHMVCRPHVIYKVASTEDSLCGNQSGQWSSFEELHGDALKKLSPRVRRSTEPRYLELALIMDRSMYLKNGFSEDRAMETVLEVTNIIDMYYQSLNIRVGLIYSEFWTEDKMNVSSNPRETLQNFVNYASAHLREVEYDLAHLVSGITFDEDSSGLAIPDSVCLKRGVAVVSSQSEDNSRHLASVISHMIGHNIGLLHDTKECECEDKDLGCIMDMNMGSKSPSQFSSCSVSRLDLLNDLGLGSCLLGESQRSSFTQSCGNGFVERGEQCDCGTAENCERVDPCCDPSTCLLKANARCKSGPCCHKCLPKASNEVCREADGECDAAEYCDGVTGECPADHAIANGQPCSGGHCYNGRCPSHDAQCKQFWDSEATSAHKECYTYNNPQGNLFGHCGLDSNGLPTKCLLQDSFCGLLQCQGGTQYAIQSNLEYRTTSVGSNANEKYKCKVVIADLKDDIAAVGMVLDGSMCGEGMVCMGSRCVIADSVLGHTDCPAGANNLTCSGNGRCTTAKACSCNRGYEGILCDKKIPVSLSETDINTGLSSPEDTTPMLDVKWLIVIICVVAVVTVSAAVIAFLFCRRQVVSPNRKKSNKRKESHLNESIDLEKDRAITFGQTPSYRSDKDGTKRKRRRKRKPSSSGEDKTDSDEKPSSVRVDIPIPEELSRQPQRGILKKSTSSAFEGIEDDECHSQCSCTDTGSCSCSDHETHSVPSNIHNMTHQDSEQGIPPPREFETNAYRKKIDTSVEVEINPCMESSPTNSEHMPEVDQYYKTFTPPYSKYNSPLPYQSQQGADSATDSAIDMPGDGSVSTINDIAPHHHGNLANGSGQYKHRPTALDYLELHSHSDDSRSSRIFRPPPPPYVKKSPSVGVQGQISNQPVIIEYNTPPVNRFLEMSGIACAPKISQSENDMCSRNAAELRVDDSVVV